MTKCTLSTKAQCDSRRNGECISERVCELQEQLITTCRKPFEDGEDCELRGTTNRCHKDSDVKLCSEFFYGVAIVPRNAPKFLHQAAEIMEERGKQYNQPSGERSMLKTVTAFNTVTGQNLSESEGWLFMQILKDVRQWQNPDYHQDSAEDGVAYSALKAEALERGD